MRVAFGFSSHFFEQDDHLQNLAESTVQSVPIVIVEWNYPVLPSHGDLIDLDLLSSFSEVPKELVMGLEYSVDYVYWALHDQEIIPIVQLRGK